MLTHKEIRQMAENIRDCVDKSRALRCSECKAKHGEGFLICRSGQYLKIAQAIEQLLAEAEQ